MVQLSHPYMTTGKIIALIIQTLVGKVMSPLFNTLSRFVIAFLSRSKHLLISWLQSLSKVTLEPKKIKSGPFPPSVCHRVMELDVMTFVFWMSSYSNQVNSLSSSTLIQRMFSFSLLSAIRVALSAYLRLLIFLLATLNPASESSSLAFCVMYFWEDLVKDPAS